MPRTQKNLSLTPELLKSLGDYHASMNANGVRLSETEIVNAALLQFLDAPPEQQIEALKDARMLDSHPRMWLWKNPPGNRWHKHLSRFPAAVGKAP